MIFLVLPVIAIIIVMIKDLICWHRLDSDTVTESLIWILISILLAFVFWGLSGLCGETAVSETETYQISALADNVRYSSHVSGSVFLIQSRVDETLKYSYMYMTDKGYAFNEVKAKTCYINHTNGTPYVIQNRYDYANPLFKWLFPNPFGCEHIFYIPEDAQIIDDFTIDFN